MERGKVIKQIYFRPSGISLSSLPRDGFVLEKLIWETNIVLLIS